MLNYIAPLNSTGYGNAALGYAAGFIANGININYCVIGEPDTSAIDWPYEKYKTNIIDRITNSPDPKCPSVVFWHANALDKLNLPDRREALALTTFEIDRLTPNEIANLSKFAKITTASKHTNDVLHGSFIAVNNDTIIESPVPHAMYVVNSDSLSLGLPEPIPYWSHRLNRKINKDTLVVSSVGKFEKRKGFYKLLDIAKDSLLDFPLLIVAQWNNPFIPGGLPMEEFHSRGFKPLFLNGLTCMALNNVIVILMPRVISKLDLLHTINQTHFFVSTSLAEGFNLPLYEAVTIGVAPILANSAIYDYISDNNQLVHSVPVEDHFWEVAKDNMFFNGFGLWKNYTISGLVKAFNSAYTNKSKAHNFIINRAKYALTYSSQSHVLANMAFSLC